MSAIDSAVASRLLHCLPAAFPLLLAGAGLDSVAAAAAPAAPPLITGMTLSPPATGTAIVTALVVIGLVALVAAGHRWRTTRGVRRAEGREEETRQQAAQTAREHAALVDAHERLYTAHGEATSTRDSLLHLLEQVRVGALTIDGDGIIQDISPTPQPLWGPDRLSLRGRHWAQCLSLSEADSHSLRARLASGGARRQRQPLHVGIGGRRYWMEIDVIDDARHDGWRTLSLHDVTETYVVPPEDQRAGPGNLVGRSRAMQSLYDGLRAVAAGDITVLIEGETGTGKELVAQAIHQHSPRRLKPFVTVNVATLTESLVASQLFGHRRGAFTGAISDQLGLFQAADGGTLFLDEIGDVPMNVQLSLLRTLQEGEVLRIGDSRPRTVDVRVIAATHRDLFEAVERGTFRQDLLYRIRVATLALPPLRDRADDIPLLVEHFLTHASRAPGMPQPALTQDAMTLLARHAWPGNVRELKNVIDQAVLRARNGLVTRDDLPEELFERPIVERPDLSERERLLDALSRVGGNRTEAARLLGVSRSTFYRRWRHWFGEVDPAWPPR